MDKPVSVNNAVNLIWTILGLFVILALIDKWTEHISEDEFMFTLLMYGLYCIIPYKLNNRSNAARYFYAVMVILSILMLLGGITGTSSQITQIAVIITTPIEIFIVFLLFRKESIHWFTDNSNV